MPEMARAPRARSILVRMWVERTDQLPYFEQHLRVVHPDGRRREFDSPQALTGYLSDFMATMEVDADAGGINEPRS